jgi:hypothetical protein
MCAQKATPPDEPDASSPPKNRIAIQYSNMAHAGKANVVAEKPRNTRVNTRTRGNSTRYAPMIPLMAPEAPTIGMFDSGRAGVKAETMRDQLGHSSVQITLDIYSHVDAEDAEPAKIEAYGWVNGTPSGSSKDLTY